MTERYSRLFALPQKNLYLTGSPVLIADGALLKDNQTGWILAQLKFQNIDSSRIKALKVSIDAWDNFGTALPGVPEYQYIDLDVARDEFFGTRTAIPLPRPETRSFACKCLSIVFTDGSIWTAEENAAWMPLIKPHALEDALGDLADQFRRDTGVNAPYMVTDDRDLWYCVCGAINRKNEAVCHVCNSNCQILLNAADSNLLQQHLSRYKHQQAEIVAREAKEREEKTSREAKQKEEVDTTWKAKQQAELAHIRTVIGTIESEDTTDWQVAWQEAAAWSEASWIKYKKRRKKRIIVTIICIISVIIASLFLYINFFRK